VQNCGEAIWGYDPVGEVS